MATLSTIAPFLRRIGARQTASVALLMSGLAVLGHLALRDDRIDAAVARQTAMQAQYEQRIAQLRAEIERARLDRQTAISLVEDKVETLLQRQKELARRYLVLEDGDATRDAALASAPDSITLRGSDGASVKARIGPRDSDVLALAATGTARGAGLARTRLALRGVEYEQVQQLDAIAQQSRKATIAISDALRTLGVTPAAEGEGSGGPLVPLELVNFDSGLQRLDSALRELQMVKDAARRLPLARPLPGAVATSGYGIRRDPLLGIRALHTGVDFQARAGAPVRAAGGGTVILAGRNGGYGLMVEIDHGDGHTSRYAHLQSLRVAEGDTVEAGTVIGSAGSSGRSTGPHLHYEVRSHGRPMDPTRYLRAGERIAGVP